MMARLLLSTLILATLASCPAVAAEGGPGRFRRIYVPAGQPDRWPTQGKRYIPIEQSEFARLLEDAQAGEQAAPGIYAARLARADYTAQVENEDTLSGRAVLEITHYSSEPTLLSLTPWSAAITQAHWLADGDTDKSEPDTSRPAVLGNDAQGMLKVLVPRSGRLAIKWNVKGQRNLSGTVSFPFRLPQTSSSTFVLDAPAAFVPELDRALVEELPEPDEANRRWNIETGGRNGGLLRMTTQATREQRREMTLYRQTDHYQLTTRGVDLMTTVRIDAHGDPLARLTLNVDPGLRIISVRIGGNDVPWTVATDPATQQLRATIEPTTAMVGAGNTLQIQAIAPLAVGELWQLPRVRFGGMFWQEGKITLQIRSPLILNQLIASDARQTRSTPLTGDAAGESVEVQCFVPDAKIQLNVNRPENRLAVESGARIEFFANEMVAHVVADISATQGEQATLRCRVGPLWQIDTVEGATSAVVTDWDVEGADPARQLVVRLAAPVRPAQSVRLVIKGRRVLSLNNPLGVHDLTVLTFQVPRGAPRYLLLQEPESLDLQFQGAEDLSRLEPTQVNLGHPLHVDPMPRGLAFINDGAAERLSITLQQRKPQFSTTISQTAALWRDNLNEQVEFELESTGVTMDRALLYLSRDDENFPWQWSADKALGPLVLRRLTADEQRAVGAVPHGHVWEVSWRVAQREPFKLRTTRTIPWKTRQPLTLASAPDAFKQTGQILVRSLDGSGVQIINRRLQPRPAGIEITGELPTVRGVFRFDPVRDSANDEDALEVAPAAVAREETGAWAWSCQLDSRLSAAGPASHLAVFRIETVGQSSLQINLPADADLRDVWVDQAAFPLDDYLASSGRLTVRLPVGREFVTVTLSYYTSAPLPRAARYYRPTFPTLDIPVFARRWRLWLPNGYDLPSEDIHAHPYTLTPHSWPQRVFGFLGRGANAPSRNPLEPEFWSFGGPSATELEGARQVARQVLLRLGTVASASRGRDTATWGHVLTNLELPETVDFRIAATPLAEVGINPATRLSEFAGETPAQQGADLLRRANLSLLIRGNHVLLAATPLAALNHRATIALGNMPAAYVGDGPLAEELSLSSTTAQSHDFSLPAAWKLAGESLPVLWTLPPRAYDILTETRGWKAYQFDVGNATNLSVAVRADGANQALMLGLFLLFFSVGLWKGREHRHLTTMSCLVAVAAALILPVAWTNLASAVFLGMFAGLVCLTCFQRVPADLHLPAAGSSAERMPAMVTATLLGFAVLLLGGHAGAQQPTDRAGKPERPPANRPDQPVSPPVATVLVPIDQAQRLVGTKVYVPEDYYQSLLQNAAEVRAVPRDWLLTRARYRSGLDREIAGNAAASVQIRAAFDVYVFGRRTRVRLPLGGEGLRVTSDSLQIDGRPARSVSIGPHEIAFDVEEPGLQHVELTLAADVQQFGAVVGFEAEIPAVGNAQADFTGTDAAQVDVPTALGQTSVQKTRGLVNVQLGGTSALQVRWPQRGGAEGVAAAFELDELQLARIQPGSMVIEYQMNVRVSEGRVRQLRLLTDPRLRLISPTGGESPLASVRVLAGEPQVIDLELSRPIVDQGTVAVRFVVTGASGVGNLRVPRCEVAGIRSGRRWFAVMVDPGLEYRQEVGEDVQPLAIPEFVAAWGDETIKPQAAFRMPREEALWVLSTQPKATVTRLEETLALAVEPRQTLVRWQGQAEIVSGYAMQRHFRVPADLAVESVTVKGSKNEEFPSRWSRNSADGSVTLLLKSPLTDPHRIVIEGRLRHEPHATYQVPQIVLEGGETTLRRLAVFRHPQVVVHLSPSDDWDRAVVLPAGVDGQGLGTLVETLTTSVSRAMAEVRVEPNLPQYTATQLLTVNRDGGEWTADLDIRLRVTSGLLDSVAVEIPREWQTPAIVEPAASGATTLLGKMPDSSGRRLVIRPAEPIRAEYRILLRGAIALTEGNRLRVPSALVRGATETQRYVLLPDQVDLQTTNWDLTGLEPAEIPAPFELTRIMRESHAGYRANGETFQASLRPQGQGNLPLVELAEVHLNWNWDGSCHGVASYALVPSGLKTLAVQLPAGLEPMHCRAGSIPVRLREAEGGWQMDLPSSDAAQLVVLVFAGTVGAIQPSDQEAPLQLPQLPGVKVVRTLWSISAPWQASALSAANPGVQATAVHLQALKMDAALALGTSGPQYETEGGTAEPVWSAPAERLGQSASQQAALIVAARQGSAEALDNLAAKSRAFKRTAMGATATQGRALVAPADAMMQARSASAPTVLGAISGASQNATLLFEPRLPGNLLLRWAVAIGLLLLAVMVSDPNRNYLSWFWPPALVGLLAAAAWWLWLVPGVIALALLIVPARALVSSVRTLARH